MKYDINNYKLKNISSSILDQFKTFLDNHPLKSIKINNHKWKYIIGGQGNNTILQLPGGLRNPIYRFEFILELEKSFRFISPLYPRICEIKPLLEGIVKILEEEQINNLYIFGASFGGLVAQTFIQHYPNLVKKVVISNSGTTYKDKLKLEKALKISKKKLKFIKNIPGFLVRHFAIKIFTRIMKGSKERIEMFKALLKNEINNRTFDKADLICHFKTLIDFFEKYNFTPNDLENWNGNILIISSDDDKGVMKDVDKRLKEVYPNARNYMFHNAGHSPLFSYKEEFTSMIIEFFKE